MADRPAVTQADRSELQNRIDQSLNYILNGPGAFWPDGGSRPISEIFGNLLKYRTGLPGVEDVNDPEEIYRSVLLDLDQKIFGLRDKIRAAGKFPDESDVLPPFPDDHIELQPPSPFFPQPSQKDLLNKFNNPISFQPNGAAVPDGQTGRSSGGLTYDPAQASPPLQPDAMQGGTDNSPTRSLVGRAYDPSRGSPFKAQPAPAPMPSDGSFSLNDTDLECLKRLNAT